MLDRTVVRNLLLSFCLVLAGVTPGLGQTPAPNARSPLGSNLGPLADWTGEWVFIDAFHASRPWISGSATLWDDGRALSTDANGWISALLPGQIARTAVLSERTPPGTYIVLYDGSGTIEYGEGATIDAGQSRPGRHVLQVGAAKSGVLLYISATTAGNPVRNIRVIMPGGTCSGDRFRYAKDSSGCAGVGSFVGFE